MGKSYIKSKVQKYFIYNLLIYFIFTLGINNGNAFSSNNICNAEEQYIDKFETISYNQNVSSLYFKGLSLYNLEQYDKAHDVFEKITSSPPDSLLYFNALYFKGLSLYNLEQYDKAHDVFDVLLYLNSIYSDALHSKGRSLLYLGNYSEDGKVFDEVLYLNSIYSDALYFKGKSLLYLGNYSEAGNMFDDVLALEPNNVDVLNDRGLTLLHLGNYTHAIDYFEKALKIDPYYTPSLKNIALAYHANGNFTEAIKSYDKYLSLIADDPEIKDQIKRNIESANNSQPINLTGINNVNFFEKYTNSTLGVTFQYPSYLQINSLSDGVNFTFPNPTDDKQIKLTVYNYSRLSSPISFDSPIQDVMNTKLSLLSDTKTGFNLLGNSSENNLINITYSFKENNKDLKTINLINIERNNIYDFEYTSTINQFDEHFNTFRQIYDSLKIIDHPVEYWSNISFWTVKQAQTVSSDSGNVFKLNHPSFWKVITPTDKTPGIICFLIPNENKLELNGYAEIRIIPVDNFKKAQEMAVQEISEYEKKEYDIINISENQSNSDKNKQYKIIAQKSILTLNNSEENSNATNTVIKASNTLSNNPDDLKINILDIYHLNSTYIKNIKYYDQNPYFENNTKTIESLLDNIEVNDPKLQNVDDL